MPRYKPGDKVTCQSSGEINQPMEIVGLCPWNNSSGRVTVYLVSGTHRKGNTLQITLEEGVLEPWDR